jgi:putative membrane protein
MPPTNGSSTAATAPSDSTFASTAAAAGLAEIRMGQVAEQKAQSTRVRTFATQMVTDHTQLAHRLAAIAQRKGLTLPTEPGAQDASALADLSSKSGASFDSAYLHTQVADHEVALSAFRQEAEHGTDPDLKAFAQAALPTLQQHLRMAQQAEQGS